MERASSLKSEFAGGEVFARAGCCQRIRWQGRYCRSLQYVLVSQDAMRVEWFTREGVGPEGVCRLEGLAVRLKFGRVDLKVEGVRPVMG